MRVVSVSYRDFRNIGSAHLELEATGITVLAGVNGAGKSNLLEGIGYLASRGSFRGAQRAAMVRTGRSSAALAGDLEDGARTARVEAEIPERGREKILLNGKPIREPGELSRLVGVTVMTPDDADLVAGGPEGRRAFLDETIASFDVRHGDLRRKVDRVLRQRAVLLQQAGGRLDAPAAATLDVWDAQLDQYGTELVRRRRAFVEEVKPVVAHAYCALAGNGHTISATYCCSWGDSLLGALGATRAEDLRRGTTGVGPHRDDVALAIGGMAARTHASRGEQRSLAFALRLGGHEIVTSARNQAPLLLLDDVFSDLDPGRSSRLVAQIPPGQAVLTTATQLPPAVAVARYFTVAAGELERAR